MSGRAESGLRGGARTSGGAGAFVGGGARVDRHRRATDPRRGMEGRWVRRVVAAAVALLLLVACGRRTVVAEEIAAAPAAAMVPRPMTAKVWPEALVPANLGWLVVSFSAAVAREDAAAITLVDGDVRVAPEWVWSAADAEVHGAILWGRFADERCSEPENERLCEGHTYVLQMKDVALTELRVGPEARVGPQWTGVGSVEPSDGAVRLTRQTDLPCVLSGAEIGLSPDQVFEPQRGATIMGLGPDQTYHWEVRCTDAAGFSSPAWTVDFRTSKQTRIVISELVVDPRHDWNDSQFQRGEPFDALAELVERASPTDEWVELWNAGDHTTDVSAWTVAVEDGTPSETRIGDAQAFGAALLPADGRLVLRLSPAGSNASNKATIVLRDAIGIERDRVVLGSEQTPDGDSASAADEALGACGDGDTRTWQKTAATPGAPTTCQ